MNLNKSIKIGKKEYNLLDIIAFAGVILLGAVIRILLFEYESQDYKEYIKGWFELIGYFGVKGLGNAFYDYTPPYMYVLCLIYYLPINNLVGVKIFSCIFDCLIAVFATKACKELREDINPLIPFAFFWFCPTIISNSAMWGQSDAFYSFFVILSFYYVLKDKPVKSFVYFGCAFAIKLQCIFFAPVLMLVFFLQKAKWRHVFLVPVPYIAAIIPVWILGRPLKELLTIYLFQTGEGESLLSPNYPNIFHLIQNDTYVDLYEGPAVIFAFTVLAVFMYWVLKKCYAIGISKTVILQVAYISGLLCVFFLPNMRERYSYYADIFAILYGLTIPKKLYVPILKIGITYIAYTTYYAYGMYTSYAIPALLGLFLIFDAVRTLMKTFEKENSLRTTES